MTLFARIVLDPSTLGAWVAVGVVCAWLAGKVMEDATYGLMGDLVLGTVGAIVGACVYGLAVEGNPAFWGGMVGALAGACVLIGGARAIAAVRGA
jgi:uncharacterized membrane protein YeaQ/YmgE (transglycosylase-associated protein family)